MRAPAVAEVRRARCEPEREAALRLRREVFCEEQGVPLHDEVDGRDDDAVHLVALRDGEVLGTCRLLFARSTCQLSRMAVARAARGGGIGGALLRCADEEARAAGARRIALHAQIHAADLYRAHGYRPHGPRFMEAGIEHVAMEKAV